MQETLWFDIYGLLMIALPFVGLLAAGLSKRTNPVIRGTRVLRHDGPARLAHWSIAIGTCGLLLSGIVSGTRFTPAFLDSAQSTAFWFNLHFAFALLFLFGTCYWLGNTIIARYRFREHLPRRHAVSAILSHYGSLLHIKGCTMPDEEKYFESERVAFIMALLAAGLGGLSGIVKALAHLVSLPGPLMNVATWTHDISAVLMLLFFVAHLFFGTLLPMAWKAFPSMITGYIRLDVAEEEYPAWARVLKAQEAKQGADRPKEDHETD